MPISNPVNIGTVGTGAATHASDTITTTADIPDRGAVILGWSANNTRTPTSIGGTAGLTFVQVSGRQDIAGNGGSVWQYLAINTSGAPILAGATVVINFASGNMVTAGSLGLIAEEIEPDPGIVANNFATTGTAWSTGSTGTRTVAEEISYSVAIESSSGATTSTTTAPATELHDFQSGGRCMTTAYEKHAATGASSIAGTWSTTNAWAACIASYKLVAAGGAAQTLTGTGIASSEAFGAGTVAPGAVTLAGAAIASSEAMGAGTVTPGAVTLTGTGIASSEAFGAGTITQTPPSQTLTGTGIASSEALGAGTVAPGAVTLGGTGIASSGAFGAGTVTPGAVTITGAGIGTSEAFGAGTAVPGAVALAGAGIASSEAFGAGTVAPGAVTITGAGIASVGAFGAGTVDQTAPPQTLTGTGIASSGAFGVGTVTPGAVSIAGAGIASAGAFGAGTVAPGAVTLGGLGIASSGAFGGGTVTAPPPQTLAGVGIVSLEAFGVGDVAFNAPPDVPGRPGYLLGAVTGHFADPRGRISPTSPGHIV